MINHQSNLLNFIVVKLFQMHLFNLLKSDQTNFQFFDDFILFNNIFVYL